MPVGTICPEATLSVWMTPSKGETKVKVERSATGASDGPALKNCQRAWAAFEAARRWPTRPEIARALSGWPPCPEAEWCARAVAGGSNWPGRNVVPGGGRSLSEGGEAGGDTLAASDTRPRQGNCPILGRQDHAGGGCGRRRASLPEDDLSANLKSGGRRDVSLHGLDAQARDGLGGKGQCRQLRLFHGVGHLSRRFGFRGGLFRPPQRERSREKQDRRAGSR